MSRLTFVTPQKVKPILFACTHDAGRSQMAAAFFNLLAPPTLGRAISAGTTPADFVYPKVVEVMAEVGIDLKHARPQKLTYEVAKNAQLLIGVGFEEYFPVVSNLVREDWSIPNPKDESLEGVRQIRDDILRRVRRLIKQLQDS